MNKFFLSILIFSQIAFAKSYLPSRRPSFPCEKAKTKIEKEICKDDPSEETYNSTKNLDVLDYTLDREYKKLLAEVSASKIPQIKSDQVNWLRDRKSCLTNASLHLCLIEKYSDRIEQIKNLRFEEPVINKASHENIEGNWEAEWIWGGSSLSIMKCSNGICEYTLDAVGENSHACSASGKITKNKLKWIDFREDYCQIDIELVQSSGKLKVKSYVGCFEDCGANINFDGIYRPIKSK